MADIKPPFNLQTANDKVKFAQNMWNSKDPNVVYKGYTEDCIWRNRDVFIKGHEEIRKFLENKWQKEKSYKLRKELFAFTDNKIAVQFWYEYQDDNDQWWRCYGLEDWTFDDNGKMKKRQMSGNDVKIDDNQRWFKGDVDVNKVEISEKHW